MMIIPFLLATTLQSAGDISPEQALPPAVAEIARKADQAILNGDGLPADYRLQLLGLPPDERLMAIIYLRRSGLLRDAPWSLDEILRPAVPAIEGE